MNLKNISGDMIFGLILAAIFIIFTGILLFYQFFILPPKTAPNPKLNVLQHQ